jgi:hypothetical protein
MALTKKEQELITNATRNTTSTVWTKSEKEKIIESKNMGATPMIIYNLKIFPGKTYKQIRDKFYNV